MGIVSTHYTGEEQYDKVLRELHSSQSLCEAMISKSYWEKSLQMERLRNHLAELHGRLIRMQDSILIYRLFPNRKDFKKTKAQLKQVHQNFVERGWMF